MPQAPPRPFLEILLEPTSAVSLLCRAQRSIYIEQRLAKHNKTTFPLASGIILSCWSALMDRTTLSQAP